MAATAMCALALRCTPAARLVARQRRCALALPRRALSSTPARAQSKGEGEEKEKSLQASPQQQRTVAPRGGLDTLPSLGRMNQMFRQMEEEMSALTRAFGMPSLMPSGSLGLFDLPAVTSAAADLPAMMSRSLAVDIKDTGSEIQIVADVPGLSKDDIKVQVSPDRVLTISGERKSEHQEGSEAEGNLRLERSYGFRLPENVDTEGIKAVAKEGVLRLTVPKTEESKPKQIDVQVSE